MDAKIIIKTANNIGLKYIFEQYDLKIDQFNKKICCPFPFHKERTPSFYYYPHNNSFYCFGCKNGGQAVNFVSLIENIDKEEAAQRIIKSYSGSDELSNMETHIYEEFQQKQDLYLEFSNYIRQFILKNNNEQALDFCEKITLVFDTLNDRNSISNDGLKILIDKLKKKVDVFECGHQLV